MFNVKVGVLFYLVGDLVCDVVCGFVECGCDGGCFGFYVFYLCFEVV